MSDSVTPWTVACQALLLVEFSGGLSFSAPRNLPDPGTEPPSLASPALAGGFAAAVAAPVLSGTSFFAPS